MWGAHLETRAVTPTRARSYDDATWDTGLVTPGTPLGLQRCPAVNLLDAYAGTAVALLADMANADARIWVPRAGSAAPSRCVQHTLGLS